MLCNECIKGYYLTGGVCKQCPSSEAYITIFAVIIFGGGVLG